MSERVVLLFGPDAASNQQDQSIVQRLQNAGYEVMEAHDLNTAAALLYVARKVEAVVVDTNKEIDAQLMQCVTAIRPGLPLLLSNQIIALGPQSGASETSNEMEVVTIH